VQNVQIQRAPISEQAANAIREMIVDGRLADGERINEVRLAAALGVSRTPLREALGRLASEGALTSAPNIGYSVRPLSVDEFNQLYDIRPILDPEALRLAGLPPAAQLAGLEALNRRFAEEADAEARIALDDEWHLALIAGCPNRLLVELIEAMMLRTRRYELAYLRERGNLQRAVAGHAAILAALSGGNLEAACAALKRNMQDGKGPLLAWLEARAETRGAA
jgi:DNA-binding GntR family transcriptional regulator